MVFTSDTNTSQSGLSNPKLQAARLLLWHLSETTRWLTLRPQPPRACLNCFIQSHWPSCFTLLQLLNTSPAEKPTAQSYSGIYWDVLVSHLLVTYLSFYFVVLWIFLILKTHFIGLLLPNHAPTSQYPLTHFTGVLNLASLGIGDDLVGMSCAYNDEFQYSIL